MVIETPTIPNDMVDLMKALAKQVIKENPDNIYEFAAKFFEDLLIKRDGSLDKGYGKFRRYEKYCAIMEKMEKRPTPKSIGESTRCSNYDSTDSGVSSGGEVAAVGRHGALSLTSGSEGPPIEVNGVAMKAMYRKHAPKSVRKPRNISLNSPKTKTLVSIVDVNEEQQSKTATKSARKLSSKKPAENLIVIAEETSSDVADSEQAIRHTAAAVRIQRAFRRCVIRAREKKEIRAAEIIQKAYKVFVAKRISNFEVDGLKPIANHFVKLQTFEDRKESIPIGIVGENVLLPSDTSETVSDIDQNSVDKSKERENSLIAPDESDTEVTTIQVFEEAVDVQIDSHPDDIDDKIKEPNSISNESTIDIDIINPSDNFQHSGKQENELSFRNDDFDADLNIVDDLIESSKNYSLMNDNTTLLSSDPNLIQSLHPEIDNENHTSTQIDYKTGTKEIGNENTYLVEHEMNEISAPELALNNAEIESGEQSLVGEHKIIEIHLESASGPGEEHLTTRIDENNVLSLSIKNTSQENVSESEAEADIKMEDTNSDLVSKSVETESNNAITSTELVVSDSFSDPISNLANNDQLVKVIEKNLNDDILLSNPKHELLPDTTVVVPSKEFDSIQDSRDNHLALNHSNEPNVEIVMGESAIITVPLDSYLELSEQSPREEISLNPSEINQHDDSLEPSPDSDIINDADNQNQVLIQGDKAEVPKVVLKSNLNDAKEIDITQYDGKALDITIENPPALKKSPTILRDMSSLHVATPTSSPISEPDQFLTAEHTDSSHSSPLPSLSSSAPTPESEPDLSEITVVDTTEINSLDIDSNSNVDNTKDETPISRLPSPIDAIQPSAPTATQDSDPCQNDIAIVDTIDNNSVDFITVVERTDNNQTELDKDSNLKNKHNNVADEHITSHVAVIMIDEPHEPIDLKTQEQSPSEKEEPDVLSQCADADEHVLFDDKREMLAHETSDDKSETDSKENIIKIDDSDAPLNRTPSSTDQSSSIESNHQTRPVNEPIASSSIAITPDGLGECVDLPKTTTSSHAVAELIQTVFPSPVHINRITEDDESETSSSDESHPNQQAIVKPIPLVPYEPLLSSDLSETDDVQIRRCATGDSCVDETSRDELDELSEVENVDLTSFGEDSLEAMYYRIRKDEILLDKSRKQMSAGKLGEQKKSVYDEHGISEQPTTTDASNLEEEYELHGVSEQMTTEVSSNPEDDKEELDLMAKSAERVLNPVEFAIEQQRVLIQKLHHGSVNYEDVVTPLGEDQDGDDQYPDSLDIRRKMWASSVSETDSDYVDLSAHRLARDDFNISTAIDHMMSSSDSGSTIVSAATKIQAGARGFLTRRRMRRSSGGTSAASVDKTCSFGNAAIDKSLEDLIEQQELLTMDEAVVKVQRFYRMYRQRKRHTAKQQRLIVAHECDDSQCPVGGEEDDANLSQSQDQVLAGGDVIDVRFEQKKTDQPPSVEVNGGSAKFVSSPLLPNSDKEIASQQQQQPTEQSGYDQQQPALDDVGTPAKIAPNDALRGGSPPPLASNKHLSIAASSAADSFGMDSAHHQRRRLTLHRGDAVQRYSSPDASSPQATDETTCDIVKTALPSSAVQIPPSGDALSSPAASTQSKCQRKLLLGIRQNSMPVQIDSDLIRIIPKHLRKRIKSAGSSTSRKEVSRKSNV